MSDPDDGTRPGSAVTAGTEVAPSTATPRTDSIRSAISRHVRSADTTWILVGSVVGGGCAYLFQVIGARGLGQDAFAPIGVLWTIQYLILSIPMLSLEAWVTRETGRGSALGAGLRAAAVSMVALAAGLLAVGVVFADPLFDGFTDFGAVAGLLVLAFGVFVIARGDLAGNERFRAYGLATGGESFLRLLLLIAVLATVGTTRSVAWILPVGPTVVALVWIAARRRPAETRTAPHPDPAEGVPVGALSRTHSAEETTADDPARSGGFLAATTVSNAAAQVLLAGGPLFLVPLGAGAVEFSIFFVTITAARLPLVFAIGGLLSRLLPPLTRVVDREDAHALRRLTALAVIGTAGGAVIAAGAAALLGPAVIAFFFGEGFRPERYFVTLTAASAVLATGNLALNQVMIALRAERHLPAPWLAGLAAAIVVTVAVDGTATDRVITGLLVGEILVLIGLTLTAVWRSTTHRVAAAAKDGRLSA